MKVIAKGRQQGKTTEAIKLAARHHCYIICLDRQQVQYVARLARELNLNIPFPLTWQEFVDKRYYGQNINGFVIDNINQCLQSMTNVKIEAITVESES